MSGWYVSREAVKRAGVKLGSDLDASLDRAIAAASREVDGDLQLRPEAEIAALFPRTETRYFDWPQRFCYGPGVLKLDLGLLSITTLTHEGDDLTAIAASDYFLEPVNDGPPYDRIVIDRASSESFSYKDTPQRAIRVTGSWGPVVLPTVSAGELVGDINSSVTTLVCSNAALIDVGDTLLIGTEQIFVREKGLVAVTTLNGALTANTAEKSVTFVDGSLVKQPELFQVDAERMLSRGVSGHTHAPVERAQDATVLAAHSSGATVSVLRSLTVKRGVNGTTAAAHDDEDAITKFVIPGDVAELCLAYALRNLSQGQSSWTGIIGEGDGQMRTSGAQIERLREKVVSNTRYRLPGIG